MNRGLFFPAIEAGKPQTVAYRRVFIIAFLIALVLNVILVPLGHAQSILLPLTNIVVAILTSLYGVIDLKKHLSEFRLGPCIETQGIRVELFRNFISCLLIWWMFLMPLREMSIESETYLSTIFYVIGSAYVLGGFGAQCASGMIYNSLALVRSNKERI